jgi:DNA-binding PadR family transcriptional regulator
MTAIHTISQDVLRVEEGSLYPALHRMEAAGWIRAAWTVNDTGRRVRAYDLTTMGRRQLDSETARWRDVTGAVNRVLRLA